MAFMKKILAYKAQSARKNSMKRIFKKYKDKWKEYFSKLSPEEISEHEEKLKLRNEKKKNNK